MAIISGTTVDWTLSPRIVTIPVSVTTVTIEDLQDTLLALEDSEAGIIWPHLRELSGGEDLGGGVAVGFTMELQNAQIAFEARTTPEQTGTATSTDTTTLTDTAATFVTNGVTAGAMLINFTDGSVSTVVSVLSETQLTHLALSGGGANDWTVGDAYTVTNEIQCEVGGGNLVAVDDVGASISPIFPTVGTQIIKTSSSSATTQNQKQLEAATFIGKEGLGITIDPIEGTDSAIFPFGTRENPCKTEVNIVDIEAQRGFRNIFVAGTLNINDNHGVHPNVWFGDNPQTVAIIIGDRLTYPSKDVTGSKFQDCYIQGELDTSNIIWECIVGPISDANGFIYKSTLQGPIVVADDISIEDCWVAPTAVNQNVDIDFNGLVKTVILSDWSAGRITGKNMVAGSFLGVSGTGGIVLIDSSCTGGTLTYGGSIEFEGTNADLLDSVVAASVSTQVWEEGKALTKQIWFGAK